MTGLLFLLGAAILGVGTYLQIRYAHLGYPRSLKWRAALFMLSFTAGAIIGLAIVMAGNLSRGRSALYILAIAFIAGLGFTFLFPVSLQNVIPKPGSERKNRRN